MTTLEENIKVEIFQQYDDEEIDNRNAVDYHMMSCGHTEILGQFLDYTGMDKEQLKDCLVRGYVRK